MLSTNNDDTCRMRNVLSTLCGDGGVYLVQVTIFSVCNMVDDVMQEQQISHTPTHPFTLTSLPVLALLNAIRL